MGKDETDMEYWFYDEPTLDECLAKFWYGASKDICEQSGDNDDDPELKKKLYSVNTLKNFCYGLNKILKSKGHSHDIIDRKTASVTRSQKAFANALKELKSEGKAEVHSFPEIEEEGKFNCNYCHSDLGNLMCNIGSADPMKYTNLPV